VGLPRGAHAMEGGWPSVHAVEPAGCTCREGNGALGRLRQAKGEH
jgi:hypothetical protein